MLGPSPRPHGRLAVVLLDSSAAIAVILQEHEHHEAALSALAGRVPGLAGHAWFETFSVLTRLPPGARQSPVTAGRILEHNFPESRFLDAEATQQLTLELSRVAISGGAVYDALVAAAARDNDLVLISGDTRASRTYQAIGATVEFIVGPPDRAGS